MSSVMSSVSSESFSQSKGCVNQISQALGRCWTWIVKAVSWIMDRVTGVLNAFAYGFFRITECFVPEWTHKMEARYLTWSNRQVDHRPVVLAPRADRTIADLKERCRKSSQEVAQARRDLAALKVDHGIVKGERNHLKKERGRDIQKVAGMKSECENMRLLKELMDGRSAYLTKENERLRKKAQQLDLEKREAKTDKVLLEDKTRSQALEQEVLQLELQCARRERDLTRRSMQLFRSLNAVVSQRG